jgi:hypothetical protein
VTNEQWLIHSIKIIMADDQTKSLTKVNLIKQMLESYEAMKEINC